MENNLKKTILRTSYFAEACHIGSALSCVDIIDKIYKIKKDKDLFIFSKASGVAALYVVLAKHGIISQFEIIYYLRYYPLPNKKVPGVIHSVGSVGMGLSVAVGLALADRKRKVYCLVSDGQLQEGITYEAALFSRQHNLKNLYVICDNNGFQACAKTKDILDLKTAITFFKKTFPHFKNVKTVKGSGVSFLENKVESHYINLTPKSLKLALKELK